MRQIATGYSKRECLKRVNSLMRQGYTPITEVKVDDSRSQYGQIRYVCVMEAEEREHNTTHSHWRNGVI